MYKIRNLTKRKHLLTLEDDYFFFQKLYFIIFCDVSLQYQVDRWPEATVIYAESSVLRAKAGHIFFHQGVA